MCCVYVCMYAFWYKRMQPSCCYHITLSTFVKK